MNKVLFENEEVIDESILNIADDKFEPYLREEEIRDSKFKSESTSYLKDVWIRFKSNKVTIVAALFILFIVAMALIGPNINDFHYLQQNIDYANLPPRVHMLEKLGILDGTKQISIQKANYNNYKDFDAEIIGEYSVTTRNKVTEMLNIKFNIYKQKGADDVYYWFGSDNLGRDVFTRLWQGTRISLLLAFSVMIVNLTIGLIIGSVAGYYGGWVDMFLQRMTEILTSIPQLPLTIILIMRLGSGILPLTIVFVLTGWVGISSSVRIQFYRFKNKEYVLASRTMGARDKRIMYKYILPNAIGTIITSCALALPNVIFQEAGLSYLGLGIQAPDPSIGQMLFDGQRMLMEYPYLIISPGFVIVVLMLAFNLLGNGLRDAFNPSLRE